MFKINYKKFLLNSIIVFIIFFLDRVSKIYILNKLETDGFVDIYLSPYLNLYLIWNKGIAFGLFSFNDDLIYNLISLVIVMILIVIILLIVKSKGITSYSLILVLGGALGNLYDRLYYSAVPDFIDFHIKDFHWFVFNLADIFITLGVISLILIELFNKKNKNEKN